MKPKFLDIVFGGPDMSGTSTQINDAMNFFQGRGLKVRDLRGSEVDALFHSIAFSNMNRKYDYVSELPKRLKNEFLIKSYDLLSKLQVASCVKDSITTYINPNSADVWVMEEPTRRGAGQVNRVIEQNRSVFGEKLDPIAAALSHQAYRTDEFFRFRKHFRETGKIILRSRSEESACYQIKDEKYLPNGINLEDYLNLPGHRIAFQNSPTHLFIVCGPENWTTEDYLKLREQRSGRRILDDHEANAEYQVLVNKRYASPWLERIYNRGCQMHGGINPEIFRFDIYSGKQQIKEAIESKLIKLLN